MKKTLTFMIAAVLFLFLLAGCAQKADQGVPAANDAKSGKISIVATLFPQYDFARQIAGDKADVKLILPPGMETHSYEPTPSDVNKINNSDMFIYTGKYMEAWAGEIIAGMKDSGSKSYVLDASQGVGLLKSDDPDAEEPYDPHIWTDPLIAKQMVLNVSGALCRIDPANADYYKANTEKYNKKLDALDAEFRTVVSSGKRKEIIFGSRFALYYFAKEYGLKYAAAFDSCSSETEPSAKTVKQLIDTIKADKIPVIYYAEIEDPKVARSISEYTGAKLLLFHSCHNVTKDELESGATYLSLMEQNVKNLKEGLE